MHADPAAVGDDHVDLGEQQVLREKGDRTHGGRSGRSPPVVQTTTNSIDTTGICAARRQRRLYAPERITRIL